MRQGWGDSDLDLPRHPIADPAARRRAALAAMFPGERLVLPSGTFKVRSYDTEYRFRADTAHAYYCGNQTSDAVLVVEDGEAVLYARPSSGRDSDEFFRDRMYGELWVGRRPSLREISDSLGLEVRHVDLLEDALAIPGKTRVLRGVSGRRRPPRPRGRVPRRGPRPGRLRGPAGQGRLGGRRAAGGLRHHHARVRGRRAGLEQRAALRRALGGGHVLPARAGDGQRHRLRLHRRRRPARDDPALDRQHRCPRRRASSCSSTWAPRAATSTPPT